MEFLINQVLGLKKKDISRAISKRMEEFESFKSNMDKIFSELCFCLLTANFQAEKSIKIQKELEKEFEFLSEDELARELKKRGHRFWPQRAKRIVKARKIRRELESLVFKKSDSELRKWLVKNVVGLGMKESSHFLRNIGYRAVAIIDFHIVDLLEREKLIKRPKTITPKKYLEIEEVLRKLGKKVKLNLAELDLYLWYLETGKVLK